MIRKLLFGIIASALAATAALAQVNVVPQVGVTTAYLARQTYSSAFFGLVPAGTTPTDILCISGSASRIVRLQSIVISGSGTAISVPMTLLKRASLDTGGTPAGTTANPGVTTQINKRDSQNGTASAVLVSYTANPTIVDTAPTYIDSQQLGVVASTVGVINAPNVFNFGRDVENFLQAPTLRTAAEQICVNLNSTTSVLLLNGSITWTEE